MTSPILAPARNLLLSYWYAASSNLVMKINRGRLANHLYSRDLKRGYNCVSQMPRIRAITEDNSMEDIPETALYDYTRHRWLYNEGTQLSKRYLKFDLQSLIKAALAAIQSPSASYCTEVLKCKEGLNNKVLILTMNDGSEIVAKMPTPCAGPPNLTTLSDVATREFLRDVLGIPAPRVISWSATRDNAVGAEYVLEERASGEPLGKYWLDCTMDSKLKIIGQIVNIERKLALNKFSKSGSIYHNDLVGGDDLESVGSIDPSKLRRFKLGPLIKSCMWDGARGRTKMDRGPYDKPLDFVKALAENELNFIRSYARPRMNHARSLTEPESPADMIDLLKRYLQIAPAIVPFGDPVDTLSPVLWHPDLHVNNIFIDPSTLDVTCIIDWQGATVLPFFYQCGVPAMCKHIGPVSLDLSAWPTRPDNFDSLSQDTREWIDHSIKSEMLHKYYLKMTQRNNNRHWNAMLLHNKLRTRILNVVSRVWEDGDISLLRRLLIEFTESWNLLCPGQDPCPLSFSVEELKLHTQEEGNREFIVEVLDNFQKQWGVPTDGMVESAKFDEIKAELAQIRALTIADAGEDALLADKLWPYQDTSDDKVGLLE